MKRGRILIVATMLCAFAASPQQAGRGANAGRAALPRSPEIMPDGKVTFRLSAPQANTVTVTGDWAVGGRVEMTKDDQGIWSATVGPVRPEFYVYSFLVDGVRTLDPNNVFITRDGARYANSLRVPGASAAGYEVNDVPHGTVSQVWYPSPSLSMTRRMFVYTPAGYEAGTTRYPVFFLLHGGGGDEEAWTSMARAPEIFDNLIAQGKARSMIVVMPNGNWNQAASQDFLKGPAPAMPNAAPEAALRFPESIVKDIIPFVDKAYRTIPSRENRAIAGLSMGGAQTWYTAFNHIDQFAWVGSFSCGCTALPGTGVTIPPPPNASSLRGPEITRQIDAAKFTALLPQLDASVNSKLRLLFVSVGLDDGETNTHGVLKQILKEKGVRYTLMETPGYAHEWPFWRLSLLEFTPKLFQPSAQ